LWVTTDKNSTETEIWNAIYFLTTTVMSFFLKVHCIVIFFSSIITFPEINFHLTDPIDDHDVEHDCLKISIPPLNEINVEEVLSFCLTQSMSKWNIQSTFEQQKFTFEQLRKQNITAEQLYQWSASIDLLEQYQFYLISNQSSLSQNLFYNCTTSRFGSQCQYEFIQLPSQDNTLTELISTYYQIEYHSKDVTCYVHLKCDRDSKDFCLDWTQICDGHVDCNDNQIDEQFCTQIRMNKCSEDEYQCKNGQCISKQFIFDQSQTKECLDGSDESSYAEAISYSVKLPILNGEDISCVHINEYKSYIDYTKTSSCDDFRMLNLIESYMTDKPTTSSTICHFAFLCTVYVEKSLEPICRDVCAHGTCVLIIKETCSEIFISTSSPVIFGHVYVGYIRNSEMEMTSGLIPPDLICYNEKLCTDFKPNVELIIINNKTCRRTQDSSIVFHRFGFANSGIKTLIDSLRTYLDHCNPMLHQQVNIVNSSLTYRCQNSSKNISINNLCNGRRDCDDGDDEVCPLINGTCFPIESNGLFFKCLSNNRCIHLTRLNDELCDCERPNGLSCEDELFSSCQSDNIDECTYCHINDYIENYISFTTVCDGFQELLPILVDESYYTDESECQYWQCNNTYTRCDGFWNCLNGADEIDCDITDCPINHHLCITPQTFQLTCLPLAKANDGHIDCLGATDEPTICRSADTRLSLGDFYCPTANANTSYCSSVSFICHSNCIDGDQDLLCNLTDSYLVKYLRPHRVDSEKSRYKQFSLGQQQMNKQSKSETINSELNQIEIDFEYNFECHRGYPLRLSTRIVCLCPMSYYGDYCQYQNQRVSLTLKFQPYSDSRRALFSFVIQLIDNSTQRTVHSTKQLNYIYVKHCQTKFNFYLTYSTRPKPMNRSYFIQIDIYEKLTFGYRGSLYVPLHFSFLPVHRVAYLLNIPRDNSSLTITCPANYSCTNHGQCMKYAENTSDTIFCHCRQGWTGKDCSIPYNCSCSSDSLCAGIEANGRSICICPRNKWGPRCFLSNLNATCFNNGQYVLSEQNLFCICPKGFSGDRCEIKDAEIILSFDHDLVLSETILVHFIEVRENKSIRNGSRFQSIPLYQNEITIRWPHTFHIVFTQLFSNVYYLIHVDKVYNRSKVIRKLLTASDRCGHISEYVNDTIVKYHLIRRIKYYHLFCQKQVSCFYDQDYFCLCNDFGSHRVANCFHFNSSHEHNCAKLSNCQHDGQCFQDDLHCPQTSRCVCRECSYGSICQFRSSLFDISLDGIIGPYIQPNVSFSKQSPIVITTLILIILMVIIGFINGVLCLLTFRSKDTRKVGCGYYLLGSTITTLLTSTMLILKCSIFLSTQMGLIANRSFVRIQCYSFDYLLYVCINMDKWFNACIAIERAFSIVKGTQFNTNQSKRISKLMIVYVILMTTISTIYDPIHRQLIDDDSNDEQRRTWCIVSYSSQLLVVNQIIYVFHFFVPFLLNIISALIIIILSIKRRRKTHKDKNFIEIVHEQMEQHRHLLISPIVLVFLSLPRLIISFVSGCMQSNSNPWIYLIGYLVSFIPPMLTFVVFVLPSKFYKEEFQKTIKEYQKTFRRHVEQ